jgi:hypothetical protein
MMNYKDVYVWGDCHGHWTALDNFIKTYNIKNSLIIQVGDMGVGMRSLLFEQYKFRDDCSKVLAESNNYLMVVRGNHDDPALFVANSPLNSEYIELVPDYTYRTINGKSFLFAGGAISVDRPFRKLNLDYWINEPFHLPEDYLNLKCCDVLITHSAPSICFPSDGFTRVRPFIMADPTLEPELLQEREDLTTLFYAVRPSLYYYGHFHMPKLEEINGCMCRALEINEFAKINL